jgi:ABC-type Fe3+-hydroxamate transport system substrate-binding protein
LFDKYEIARGAVDQLQQQLAQARQEADDVRAEMKVFVFFLR